ncbi:MAG: DUF4149 domain-containing protein, partial [Verrucomicrobiales bacterium]|nr:DUF4149 domain-containing protein [Verrucomicrobiales bacterium]
SESRAVTFGGVLLLLGSLLTVFSVIRKEDKPSVRKRILLLLPGLFLAATGICLTQTYSGGIEAFDLLSTAGGGNSAQFGEAFAELFPLAGVGAGSAVACGLLFLLLAFLEKPGRETPPQNLKRKKGPFILFGIATLVSVLAVALLLMRETTGLERIVTAESTQIDPSRIAGAIGKFLIGSALSSMLIHFAGVLIAILSLLRFSSPASTGPVEETGY